MLCTTNMYQRDFFQLKEQNNFPVSLNEFYEYFYCTYIGDENIMVRYPISFWHYGNFIDENIPRTNNAIEGWHSTFKNTFGTSRYSLHLLIEKLKNEEDAIRIKAIRQETKYNASKTKIYTT